MAYRFLDFFTDPVLRAPTIGCMLMCLSAAITGVMVFLRKQSLVGEALSHAAYPGVVIGLLLGSFLGDEGELALSMGILGGAFATACIGYWLINCLQRRLKVPADAALCVVLSLFFGAGITLASRVQFTHPSLYKQIQMYLYGQAATMTDLHIALYSLLSIVLITTVVLLYKEIKAVSLDTLYAKSLGIPASMVDGVTMFLTTFALVVGIRSVGVVLMSAMFIAPAAASRQFTNRLSRMFMLAAVFGMASGFLGNYLSVASLSYFPLTAAISLPTGPMIVVVAATICILSLLFAPQRGVLLRYIRARQFKLKSVSENILKMLWRSHPDPESLKRILYSQGISRRMGRKLLRQLEQTQLITLDREFASLTPQGFKQAARIVRLHRLWEVYLADYLAVGAEKVHRSAEEMEHIITPEIEEELIKLLHDPKKDPHHQPIPPKEQPENLG